MARPFLASLVLPTLLVLPSTARAQDHGASSDGPTVVVKAQRDNSKDPDLVNSARRVLDKRFASSCAFLEPEPGSASAATLDRKYCGEADQRFASGRQHIIDKDTSLAQGNDAFHRGDYARALEQLTIAWNKLGDPYAALKLARINLEGLGKTKDVAQAIAWYERIADSPYDLMRYDPARPKRVLPKAEAYMALARIHEQGDGVPADPAAARRWYARAADLDFPPALDALGLALLAGRGGERDAAKGEALLKAAAEAGYPPAAVHLGQAVRATEDAARQTAQALP